MQPENYGIDKTIMLQEGFPCSHFKIVKVAWDEQTLTVAFFLSRQTKNAIVYRDFNIEIDYVFDTLPTLYQKLAELEFFK